MRANRTDTNQQAIVDALRKAGCYVKVIGLPVDLLVGIPNGRGTRWQLMEVKQPLWKRPRADQSIQAQFIDLHHVPVVKTPDEALIAAGLMLPRKFNPETSLWEEQWPIPYKPLTQT